MNRKTKRQIEFWKHNNSYIVRKFDYSYLYDLCTFLDSLNIKLSTYGIDNASISITERNRTLNDRINSFDIDVIKRIIILISLMYCHSSNKKYGSYFLKHRLEDIQETLKKIDEFKDINKYVSNGCCIVAFFYLNYKVDFNYDSPNVVIYCKRVCIK